MNLVRYVKSEHADIWDKFVIDVSLNGTFLHTQKFLSYHGEKFVDMSYLIFGEADELLAVFPAAVSRSDASIIVSHPGITYGGIICGDRCRGETCVDALKCLVNNFSTLGYKSLHYKSVPYVFQRKMFQDDLYALFRLNAFRWRCDLSATIDLNQRGKVTKGRKYEINKAKKRSLTLLSGNHLVDDVHQVIVDNLQRQHSVSPVHSSEELKELYRRFPDNVDFYAIRDNFGILAALVTFSAGSVVHTQYIASYARAHEVGALDFLIELVIQRSIDQGLKYFDFGISNEDNGLILNENLYRYKRSFGAGSVVHDFYEIRLGVNA